MIETPANPWRTHASHGESILLVTGAQPQQGNREGSSVHHREHGRRPYNPTNPDHESPDSKIEDLDGDHPIQPKAMPGKVFADHEQNDAIHKKPGRKHTQYIRHSWRSRGYPHGRIHNRWKAKKHDAQYNLRKCYH